MDDNGLSVRLRVSEVRLLSAHALRCAGWLVQGVVVVHGNVVGGGMREGGGVQLGICREDDVRRQRRKEGQAK